MEAHITLDDLSRMIEGATDGSLLQTAAVRDRFFATMNQASSVPSGFSGIVAEEAARVGKAGIESSFVANTVYRGKGGSYGSGQRAARAGFGRILLPFKVGGVVVQRPFAYGHFYNCETCAGNVGSAYGDAALEKFRPAIRGAVASW